MKIKKRYYVLIGFILILFTPPLYFKYSHYNWKMEGLNGVSHSIEESKELGAFVSRIKPVVNTIKINDSTSIRIKDGWIEHVWYYPELFGNVKVGAKNKEFKYTIIIELTESVADSFIDEWRLEINNQEHGNFYIYGSFQSIIADLSDTVNFENKDILILGLKDGSINGYLDTIGTIRFVRY